MLFFFFLLLKVECIRLFLFFKRNMKLVFFRRKIVFKKRVVI